MLACCRLGSHIAVGPVATAVNERTLSKRTSGTKSLSGNLSFLMLSPTEILMVIGVAPLTGTLVAISVVAELLGYSFVVFGDVFGGQAIDDSSRLKET